MNERSKWNDKPNYLFTREVGYHFIYNITMDTWWRLKWFAVIKLETHRSLSSSSHYWLLYRRYTMIVRSKLCKPIILYVHRLLYIQVRICSYNFSPVTMSEGWKLNPLYLSWTKIVLPCKSFCHQCTCARKRCNFRSDWNISLHRPTCDNDNTTDRSLVPKLR